MADPAEKPNERRAGRPSVRRILGKASGVLERTRLRSFRSAVDEVGARATLRPSALRDHVIIDAQQEVFREMHSRFTERAGRGEKGLDNALDALDAMWLNVRALRSRAPTLMKTLSSPHGDVQEHLARFYRESTALLEDAICRVFDSDLGQLSVPPDRMAVLVRVMLEGLVIELAQARDADDVVQVDQAYADLRALFERFVLLGQTLPEVDPVELEPIPLPW